MCIHSALVKTCQPIKPLVTNPPQVCPTGTCCLLGSPEHSLHILWSTRGLQHSPKTASGQNKEDFNNFSSQLKQPRNHQQEDQCWLHRLLKDICKETTWARTQEHHFCSCFINCWSSGDADGIWVRQTPHWMPAEHTPGLALHSDRGDRTQHCVETISKAASINKHCTWLENNVTGQKPEKLTNKVYPTRLTPCAGIPQSHQWHGLASPELDGLLITPGLPQAQRSCLQGAAKQKQEG